MIDKKEIIKDLISLTGRTLTSTALESGIEPTNLSRALKGHSTVSDQKIEKALEVLGIASPGTLDSNRVHIWTLKTGDLFPLSRILSLVGEDLEMVYLIPSQFKLKNYFEFMRRPLLIRSSSSPPIKIVFRRRPPLLLPETEFKKEDVVLVGPGLAKWRKIPKKWLYPTIEVDNSTYERFYSSNELSVHEFEHVWNSLDTKDKNMNTSEGVSFLSDESTEYGWTWERLVSSLKEQGKTPGEVAKKLGL